jgi:hypothetical protein
VCSTAQAMDDEYQSAWGFLILVGGAHQWSPEKSFSETWLAFLNARHP